MVALPSPTLVPGQAYLSVLAPVPGGLKQRITQWAGAPAEGLALGHHITVLITALVEPGLLDGAGELVAGEGRLELTLGEPQTFEPATPITYLPLVRGGAELERLHRLLEDGLGASASPFPYVPHLTLSYTPGALGSAQSFYRQLPSELLSFPVEELELYSNTDGSWQRLGGLSLLAT